MMSSRGEEDMEEALRRSMVTYKREQVSPESYDNDSYEDMFEDVFSELRDETFEQEERAPRGFQQELIDTILKDYHNYIVFAPTGCGKTFIASLVAKHFLEKKQRQGRKATVLFVVDKIPLVLQQANAVQKDIGPQWTSSQHYGEKGAIENWELLVKTTHVIVAIAQTLLNCIVVKPGALADVDLVIIDECHHTTQEHPYHQIVRDHWKVLPIKDRPKIIGLTASPGGKADKVKTKEKIRSLCTNMHSKIIMVQDNIEELKGTLNPPKVQLINVILDPYLLKMISQIYDAIKHIEASAHTPYKWPEQKNSFEYMRFCENLRNKADSSQDVRSKCSLNLVLANCIQLLEDVGLECVIDYLAAQKREGLFLNEITQLIKLFKEKLKPNLAHGKRDTLMGILRTIQGQPGFKRGIIFVKTRASAHALLQTIQQHMKRFKPCLLVGHGAKGDGGGMKAKSQQKVVANFNSGVANLMIATSVAEEGLDIQACNTVIRYDALDTAEALIQSRGRARFHDSSFIVMLSGADSKKFFEALEAEKNMHDVVSEIQKKPGGFYDFLAKEARPMDYEDDNEFGFEFVPSVSSSSSSSASSSAITPYNSASYTTSNNNTNPSDLISKCTDAYGAIPQYIISATNRGFVGEANMDIFLDGLEPITLCTEEMYGKTKSEVELKLKEEIVRLLRENGELKHLVTSKRRTSPPRLPAPSKYHLPDPPSSKPTAPHALPSSYAGNNSSSAYNSTALISSYTSKPSIYNSFSTPYPSTYTSTSSYHPPSSSPSSSSSSRMPQPTAAKIKRAGDKLTRLGKMPVSYLNEWCQRTSKSLAKTCNSSPPFACTVSFCHASYFSIAGTLEYTGPSCTAKKDAEHLAATHVIAHLDI